MSYQLPQNPTLENYTQWLEQDLKNTEDAFAEMKRIKEKTGITTIEYVVMLQTKYGLLSRICRELHLIKQVS